VDERIRQLVKDMLETMYDAQGIGLAATQVDVHERVIVIDVSEGATSPWC
jgi:peptide deformylase